jgi:hypothetical protein
MRDVIISDRLAQLLAPEGAERAAGVLRAYFTPRPPGRFTGAWFERFAGGGDRPEIADHFTADDLIAVSMLSVQVVGDAALEILHTRRDRLRALLQQIPTDVALADLSTDQVGASWPVRRAYVELLATADIGPTTASKLLARKRPHLVPIYDSVVDHELALKDRELWAPLHAWLTSAGRANHRHLLELRDLAGLGHEISALRIFDVLTWMTGQGYAAPATGQG